MNGGSNSHSLKGSTPSTLPGGDFDQISTRNEHFASLARSLARARPLGGRRAFAFLVLPSPFARWWGPTRDSGNLGRESCCFANQARVNGGSNSHSLSSSQKREHCPRLDFDDKISTRNEHFTSPRSLSLTHTHTRTHTHAVSAGSLDEGRGHQANTSLLAPATFHNSQRAADARARVRLPHTQWSVTFICLGQESNLRAPSSGPAAVLFLPARRESTAASWTCKKKEKKKTFSKNFENNPRASSSRDSRAFEAPRLPPRQPLRRRGVRPKRTNLRVERLSLNRSQ